MNLTLEQPRYLLDMKTVMFGYDASELLQMSGTENGVSGWAIPA